MIRLLLVNRRFERGGAERQLIHLAAGLVRAGFDVTVATLYDGGALRAELDRVSGIRAVTLGKRGRWDLLAPMWRLWRVVRRQRPQVIHGYLGAANLVSLALGKLAGAAVVWGIRGSGMEWEQADWLARLVRRLERSGAPLVDLIVVNSVAGRADLLSHGFPADRVVVIRNGIDTRRFAPAPEARARVRAGWGIGATELLVGLVARLDPMKDHPTFLEAAAHVARVRPDVRFVCVGDGPAAYAGALARRAAALGVDRRLVWAGARDDMPAVYNALDVAVSASAYGEGVPNAIGEALACGVPCVVTDVGDAADLVGEAGVVVRPRDPRGLAEGCLRLLGLPEPTRRRLGEAGRRRIAREFSVEAMVQRTAEALERLVSGATAARAGRRPRAAPVGEGR
ncbi:MAG TPA: glycosyltransferase [Thermodesulfobacteriota bacterium]|nr:glycosyltransferase [Thermodesulfobacteriota bacterium]